MSPLGAARSPPPTCAPVPTRTGTGTSGAIVPTTAQLQPRGTARRTFGQHPVERLKRRLHYGVPDDGAVMEVGAMVRHSIVSRTASFTSPGLHRG